MCDPRHNALIGKSAHKSDTVDTPKLCRLLRLGERKRVYHPAEDHRAVFKAAVRAYPPLAGKFGFGAGAGAAETKDQTGLLRSEF